MWRRRAGTRDRAARRSRHHARRSLAARALPRTRPRRHRTPRGGGPLAQRGSQLIGRLSGQMEQVPNAPDTVDCLGLAPESLTHCGVRDLAAEHQYAALDVQVDRALRYGRIAKELGLGPVAERDIVARRDATAAFGDRLELPAR